MKTYRLNEDVNDSILKQYADYLVQSGKFSKCIDIKPFVFDGMFSIFVEHPHNSSETPRILVKIIGSKVVRILDGLILMYDWTIGVGSNVEKDKVGVECVNENDTERIYNVLKSDGTLLFSEWFDYLNDYDDYYIGARNVNRVERYGLYGKDGNRLCDYEFQEIKEYDHLNGFVVQELNGKWNMLTNDYLLAHDTGFRNYNEEIEVVTKSGGRRFLYSFDNSGEFYFFDVDCEEVDTDSGSESIINYEVKDLSFKDRRLEYLILENSSGDYNVIGADGRVIFRKYLPTILTDCDFPVCYIMVKDDAAQMCQYFDLVSEKLITSKESGIVYFKRLVLCKLEPDENDSWFDEDFMFTKNMNNKYEIYRITNNGVEFDEGGLDNIMMDDNGDLLYVKKGDKIYLHVDGKDYECECAWRLGALSKEHYMVLKNGKYGLVTAGYGIIDDWFDDVYSLKSEYPIVKRNGKYNYLYYKGGFVFDDWFDYADEAITGRKERFPVVEDGVKKLLDIIGNDCSGEDEEDEN